MKIIKDESGQALFLVMMVIMVLILTGAATLTRTSSSRLRSFEEKRMVQASYIAEAGVEKALANVKNDPSWLKELPYNTEDNYIDNLIYAGGKISSVKVIRTSPSDANPTIFYIESTGEYQGATRTIKVTGEVRDGISFAKGIWLNSATEFGNKVDFYCDIVSKSALTFKNNCTVRNIIAEGTVEAKNGMNANSIISGQDVIIKNNLVISNEGIIESDIEIISQIKAGGNISIDKGSVGGQVSAIGNITLEKEVDIAGDVYYNGTLTIKDDKSSTGTLHKGGAVPFEVNIPPLPVIDEDIYSENPDRIIESGILSGDPFDITGITYAPGNLDISGTYSGQGVVVAHGKVTISGDLKRADEDSSLVIIAFGQVDGVGISSSHNKTTYAHLFSPYKIALNTKNFYGSIICDSIDLDNNVLVSYDNDLYQNQPEGLSSAVKIKSWKEAYPVF